MIVSKEEPSSALESLTGPTTCREWVVRSVAVNYVFIIGSSLALKVMSAF